MKVYGIEFEDEPFYRALAVMVDRNIPFTARELQDQIAREFEKISPSYSGMGSAYRMAGSFLQTARRRGLVFYYKKRWYPEHRIMEGPIHNMILSAPSNRRALESAFCAIELALGPIPDDTPQNRAVIAALGFSYQQIRPLVS